MRSSSVNPSDCDVLVREYPALTDHVFFDDVTGLNLNPDATQMLHFIGPNRGLFLPSLGYDMSDRLGRAVLLHSVRLSGRFIGFASGQQTSEVPPTNNYTESTLYNFVLLRDRQPDLHLFSGPPSDLFEVYGSIHRLNPKYGDRFELLVAKRITVDKTKHYNVTNYGVPPEPVVFDYWVYGDSSYRAFDAEIRWPEGLRCDFHNDGHPVTSAFYAFAWIESVPLTSYYDRCDCSLVWFYDDL